MNAHGTPEEELGMRLTDALLPAKPLIDACRELEKTVAIVKAGLGPFSKAEEFLIHVLRNQVYGLCEASSGTHTLLPDDVRAFIMTLQDFDRKIQESKS
jgi:hypothetical protein